MEAVAQVPGTASVCGGRGFLVARPAPGVPSGSNSDVVRGIFNMFLDIVPVLDVELPGPTLGTPEESGSSPVSSKTGFLSSGTVYIWGQIILCCVRRAVLCVATFLVSTD